MFYLAVKGILDIRLRFLNRLLLVLLQDGRGDEGLDLPLEHVHVAGVVLVLERTFHLRGVGVLNRGSQTEPEDRFRCVGGEIGAGTDRLGRYRLALTCKMCADTL